MSKEIKLTQGQFAIVDDADYDELVKYRWVADKARETFYAQANIHGTNVRMHRFLLSPSNGEHVDHINRNGIDNRRCNLRTCTRAQNQHNKRKVGGTSKYKGVSWHKLTKKWYARFMKNGKQTYLGLFTNEKEAAIAYDKAVTIAHGEFARTNKMMGLL